MRVVLGTLIWSAALLSAAARGCGRRLADVGHQWHNWIRQVSNLQGWLICPESDLLLLMIIKWCAAACAATSKPLLTSPSLARHPPAK